MTGKGASEARKPGAWGRGGAFHAYLVAGLAGVLEREGFAVTIEHPLRMEDGCRDFVDILAGREGRLVAFEVETTARHALDNALKATRLHLPLCIVVPSRKIRSMVAGKLQSARLDRETDRIWILLPGEVQRRLKGCFSSFSTANTPWKDRKRKTAAPHGAPAAAGSPHQQPHYHGREEV